jgi:iron complex transport system substrate-binding protein
MKRAVVVFLLLLVGVGVCGAYPMGPDDPAVRSAMDYLHGCQKSDGGFGEAGRGSDPGTTSWALMAIVSAGEDPRAWVKDGNSTLDYQRMMSDQIIAKGGTTDIARTILTLVAAGEDPRSFAGTDYVAALKGLVKPNGQAGDHVYTTFWTVIALASVEEPVDASVQYLVSQQNADGGFPWTPGTDSDPDDTGAALMALGAAGVPDEAAVVRRAVDYLKNEQLDDGGFHYGGTSASNSASDAWVIQGLVASGEDPDSWVRSGVSAVGHLQGLQNPDGSFRYTTYVTDNPARMTASAVPAFMGIPYPVLPGEVTRLTSNGTTTIRTTDLPETRVVTLPAGTSGTSPATVSGYRDVTVTDDFGEVVTIRGLPKRIVSLGPSNTEILYALGLGDRVIGVTDYCNYPEEAQGKQKVGGYSTINIEKVVALEPDLVLASFGNTEGAIEHLRSLGLTVVTLNPQTIDDVLHDIELVGSITGTESEASICVDGLQQRIGAVTEKTADLTNRPSVAQVVWYDPIWVSGNMTFQDELIRMAGGSNAFNAIDGWTIVGLEEFVTTNPEYVIVNSGTGMGDSGYDILYDYFMDEPRFRNLSAVQDHHVYTVDADLISRGGPRIVDALELVAADLHPELFGNSTASTTPAAYTPGFSCCVALIALGSAFLLATRR